MSAAKKTFVLRLSDEMYKLIAKGAEDEFRSVNGQIEMILDKAIKESNRDQKLPVSKIKAVKSRQH